MSEKITVEGLIKDALDARLLDVHTCIVGVVDAVGETTVDVTVAIKRVNKDGTYFTVPTLPDVPVLFFGNSTLSIAHAIKVGDEGIILFNERDISGFVEKSGVSNPIILRKHEYSDAVFLPVAVSNSVRAVIPATGIELTGDVKINGDFVATGEIKGATVTDGVIDLATHKHGYIGAGTSSSPQISDPAQ